MRLLLATPLLQWYIKHGLEVTHVYQVVEFTPMPCFNEFTQKVSKARRDGKQNSDLSTIASTMKLLGNAAYGSLILDKSKYKSTVYCAGEEKLMKFTNKPQFVSACELDENDLYEVEMKKKSVCLNTPIQLGYFVLQYAKLRMLEFYFDFLDVFIKREDFELL